MDDVEDEIIQYVGVMRPQPTTCAGAALMGLFVLVMLIHGEATVEKVLLVVFAWLCGLWTAAGVMRA